MRHRLLSWQSKRNNGALAAPRDHAKPSIAILKHVVEEYSCAYVAVGSR
jgi:hypothetical protein